jgi:hypothetical protein
VQLSEREVLKLAKDFFDKVEDKSSDSEVVLEGGKRADLILDFGNEKILFEFKTANNGLNLRSRKNDYLQQVKSLLSHTEHTRAAIVVIFKDEMPEIFKQKVLTYEDGQISVVGIDMTQNRY